MCITAPIKHNNLNHNATSFLRHIVVATVVAIGNKTESINGTTRQDLEEIGAEDRSIDRIDREWRLDREFVF
jgi:hypothetical protein